MAGDSNSRQLANLRGLAQRVESPEALTGFLAAGMRMLVAGGDFGATAVSVVRDNEFCETLAVAGPAELKQALVGSRFELSSYEAELSAAESWGALRYVAVEHCAGIAVLHPARDGAVSDKPGTASIAGCLYAPLYADSGRLIGMISAEISDEDSRPGIAAQRSLSEVAVVIADTIESQLAPEDRALSAPPVGVPLVGVPLVEAQPALPVLPEPHRDAATGLPNRHGLETVFDATLERLRKDGSTAAVLYLVLEEYDSITENHGAKVADEVIRRVSKRLQDSVRAYDVIGRVSDNSMAIVADNIAPGDTSTLVSRLRRTLAKVHVVDNEVIRVRGSVGAVLVDDRTPDTASAFAKARTACEAERSGAHGTYVLYSRYDSRPAANVTSLR